ncbi:MAG: CPBP family intramembrane metalloprotease, partial [Planctomycetes bacterium]|nr:CPBP family intramembrane metalloprotease [Planctomycetota bacterium]
MVERLKRAVLCRESLLLLYATAVLCALGYHNRFGVAAPEHALLERWVTQGILYTAAAALFSALVLRCSPVKLGLEWGEARLWARYVLLFALVMAAAILAVAWLDPSFASYYRNHRPTAESAPVFLAYAGCYAVYLFGWEYFYRGFLLFGLEPRLGDFAAVVQAVPFALLHIGKPEVETYSSIAGGVILGVLALRARSMWPCFLLHAFVALWMSA